MSIKTVYLSGRIEGISYDEANKTRNKIIESFNKYNIFCYNPMRGKELLKNVDNIDSTNHNIEMQEIVSRDLADIQKSDALIVTTGDSPSWGTAMEVGYIIGKYGIYQRPIFVYMKCNYNSRYGWLNFLATKIFNDIDIMAEYIAKF